MPSRRIAPSPGTIRPPRQARGLQRVESLLESAEALIAEGGMDALSMQTLAERAGASISSIYHFFGTKDAVIAALQERFAQGFVDAVDEVRARPLESWTHMTTSEFVAAYFAPIVAFFQQHPAFVVFATTPHRRPPVDDAFEHDTRKQFARILSARVPHWDRQQLQVVTQSVFAMGEGIFQEMSRVSSTRGLTLFRELQQAIAAYLEYRAASSPP